QLDPRGLECILHRHDAGLEVERVDDREALDNELTRNRREIPMSLLWWIWRLAEQAQAKPGAAAANRLIDEILRSARWKVQSRHCRGV
ncbi:MAG: hypothetical protein R6X17_08550, partial [Candidatus Competibacteraceae bacterium]